MVEQAITGSERQGDVMGNLVSIKVKKASHDKFLRIKLLEGIPICDQVEHLQKFNKKKLK